VLLALAVAGLLRPEAWLLCGLYWLYAFGARPSRTSLRSIGGAAIVLSAPVAWLVMDSIVTGHPLFAFTNARQSGESVALGGFGNSELLSFALSLLRNAVRTPVLIGGGLGVALALAVRRRASTLPAAILILLLAVFAGFVVLELPVPNRMLLTPATLFAIFCAFAALGWLDHRPAGQRRLWAGAGAAVIVLLLATTPAEITRLEHLDQRRAALERIVSDLRGLDQLPAARAALRSCALLTVGAPEIVPYTAYYLDRPLQRLALATWPGTTTRGAYLALNSYQASAFVRGGLKPEQGISVPAGYRRVAADRSWQLLVRGC
jgi:hypothetical protein